MIHPIYRVVSFVIVAPYTLRVTFDDTTTQVIGRRNRRRMCPWCRAGARLRLTEWLRSLTW